MGSGSWSDNAFCSYVTSSRGISADEFSNSTYSTRQVYTANKISPMLNPYNVVRECRDSVEHPNTLPIILALDVTGSMGDAAMRVAQKLNQIMTSLYENNDVPDIEFCIMGIGDLYYDNAPIQISQFESDTRIAEQLDLLYFEGGGGGNDSESYTAAWYMGVNHCKLDCWTRGKKGIIITLGDEPINDYLPRSPIETKLGDYLRDDVDTEQLLEQAKEKFDIYHIAIDDIATSYSFYKDCGIDDRWKKYLGDNYLISNLDSLPQTIINIVKGAASTHSISEVSW